MAITKITGSGIESLHIDSSGNVGIGTTTPQTELHVKTANASLVHIGGTSNTSGNYQGISLGYAETGNTYYRKVAVVSAGLSDGSARQDFNILVDIAADGNSADINDSKFKISGTTGDTTITGNTTITSGNLVIGTAGKGIDFSAQTATSATGAVTTSEVLDSYEEGTWPIKLRDGGSATGTEPTYHSIWGRYTKVGRLVTILGYVYVNSTSGLSGTMAIYGLPFTSAIGGAVCFGELRGTNRGGAGFQFIANIPPSGTKISLVKNDGDGRNNSDSLQASDIGAATQWYFTASYEV